MKTLGRLSGALLAGLTLGLAATATADPPFGIETRTIVQGVTIPDTEPASPDVRLVPAYAHLSFDQPVALVFAPGDDSVGYVVEKTGKIRRFPNQHDAPAKSSKVFLNRLVRSTSEQGLLGLAFHPDYATNGYFYVYYSPALGTQRTVVSRFRRSESDPTKADASSEEVLVTIPQFFGNHKGGCLQFGPDGKLYVSIGDGGSQDDPDNRSQNLGDFHGKILRINDDGSIPADNPFVGTPGALGQIWAYGFRNPWRFSFDRATGKPWVGDVGGGRQEEVDIVEKGGNYGWRVYEGDLEHINPDGLPRTDFVFPVFRYEHDAGSGFVVGKSITGGFVYRGNALPTLKGRYLFADYVGSRVWALTQNQGTVTGVRTIADVGQPSAFGQDNAGNLFVVSLDGTIYRVAKNNEPDTFPRTLSATGLFGDLASLTPTPGMIEYGVNAPFWSDGALKRRWIVPKGSTQIGFRANGAWDLPAGTILVKHFEIALAGGSVKRLETRLLVNGDSGWRGYTYRWNDAGTDADLLEEAQTVELDVADASSPGGVRHQTYEFPSRGTCLACHNQAAGSVLGLRANQMNRDFLYPGGVTDNQLRTLNHIGLFGTDVGAATQYASLADPSDTNATLTKRARAYLDTNCSQCHRPGGPTSSDMDFRAATKRGDMHVIRVAPSAGDLGIANAKLVAPGHHGRSIVWRRIHTTGEAAMPPVGRHVIDDEGAGLIAEWIDAGAP